MIVTTQTKLKTLLLLLGIALIMFVSQSAIAGSDRIRLECEAEGPGDTSMDARYEERRARKKFDVSFEARPGGRFFAGQVLRVRVATRTVRRMRLRTGINGDVIGDLNFDTSAGALDDDLPFPRNFPNVRNRTPVRLLTTNNRLVLGCRLN